MKLFTTSPKRIPVSKKPETKTAFKVIGWGLALSAALYYVFWDALPYFALDQAVYGYHWSHGGWLLLHITGGVFALLSGPFQFWTGLRRRSMYIHRWTGRVYVGSVVVSVAAASYILTLPERSFGFRIGIAGLALSWIATTGLAYIAVLKRQMVQHKEWMIRSYVVTFGFVFFRLIFEPMLALDIATRQEIAGAVSWMCWALPLLVTELVLQGRKIFRKPNALTPAGGE